MVFHMSDNSIPQPSSDAFDEARATVANPQRLDVLRATGLLDSDVEEVFDRMSRLAVRLLGVPAAFISLVDEKRDFYKSSSGLGEPLASSRELTGPTFCHFTIQSTSPLVIPDTANDPTYREVPTVDSLGVAAYLGVPIVIESQSIGSFCAIDVKPHAWDARDIEVLSELAASAQREIELRGALRRAQELTALITEQAIDLGIRAAEAEALAAELQRLRSARNQNDSTAQQPSAFAD
jgi:GAF domain-containing protein